MPHFSSGKRLALHMPAQFTTQPFNRGVRFVDGALRMEELFRRDSARRFQLLDQMINARLTFIGTVAKESHTVTSFWMG